MKILSILLACTLLPFAVILLATNEVNDLLPARSQDVKFESNGVDIAGTLWLPEGKGPFPAIVMGHGSGRSTRTGGRYAADHFSRKGIAFLTYDKRVVGESGGVYVGHENGSEKNLKLLASNVAVGVLFLRTRNDIV